MTERDLLVLQLAEIRGHLTPDAASRIRSAGGDLSRHLSGTHLDALHRLADEILARGSKLVAGRYELLEKLGEGGMAVVFKARDLKLNRLVALKGLGRTDPEDLDRFIREARTAAQLRHPSIVEVYDIVTEGEQTFITMKYIEGKPLAAEIGKRPLRLNLEALAQAADGLHHAHREGIVHRDVKPDNILVDVEGRAYLSDFGLARKQKGATRLTLSGMVLGTPAYMSPEQARGTNLQVDAQSDVYGLGATLYELLTGVPPFSGQSAYEILAAVVENDPDPPRKRRPAVPLELEVVCLKALAKEKKHRYTTAADFAADLRRYLRGEPIAARPLGPFARSLRWSRRHPAHVAVIGTIVLSLAGVGIGFGLMKRRVGNREEAERHLQRGVGVVKDLESILDGGGNRADVESRARDGLASFRRAADADPTYALPRVWSGRMHAFLGEIDAAAREYDAAIRIDDRLAEAYFWRGRLAQDEYDRRRPPVQMRVQRTGLEIRHVPEPPDLVAIRERAHADFEKSVTLWRELAREDLPERDYTVGTLLFIKGDYEGSRQALSSYVVKRPYDALGHYELGRALFYLKRYPEAILAFERTARCGGASPVVSGYEVRCRIGQACEESDPRETLRKCLEAIDRALEKWPGYARLIADRGVTLVVRAGWEQRKKLDPSKTYAEAAEAADRALELAPDDVLALALAAHTYSEIVKWKWAVGRDASGDYGKAVERLTRLLEKMPDDPLVLHDRAEVHELMVDAPGGAAFREKRRALAGADLDRILSIQRDNAGALAKRAFLRAEGRGTGARPEDFKSALEDADRAVELEPRNPYVRLKRAWVRIIVARSQAVWRTDPSKEYGRAVEDADAGLAESPGYDELLMVRATARLELGDEESALKDAGAAIEANPWNSAAWLLLSRAHVRAAKRLEAKGEDGRPRLRDALAAAEEAMKRWPGSGKSETTRGIARSELWRAELARGRQDLALWEGALEDYTRAHEILGGDALCLLNRGNIRAEMSAHRDRDALRRLALEDFDACLKLEPNRWEAWNGRGLLRKMIAKDSADEKLILQAIEDLKKALEIGPLSPVIPTNLGAARHELGNMLAARQKDPLSVYAEARADFTEALKRGRTFVRAFVGRADASISEATWRVRLGQQAEAKAAVDAAILDCDQAIGVSARYAGAYHVRGRARLMLRDHAKARADLERALELDPGLKDQIEPLLRKIP